MASKEKGLKMKEEYFLVAQKHFNEIENARQDVGSLEESIGEGYDTLVMQKSELDNNDTCYIFTKEECSMMINMVQRSREEKLTSLKSKFEELKESV